MMLKKTFAVALEQTKYLTDLPWMPGARRMAYAHLAEHADCWRLVLLTNDDETYEVEVAFCFDCFDCIEKTRGEAVMPLWDIDEAIRKANEVGGGPESERR